MNRNDLSIVAFLMVSHALVHTYELSIPILMLVWIAEFPVTTAELGLVVSVGYGLFGLGAVPGGILADRLGSKTVVTVCLAGMGLSFLLLSGAGSVLWIAVALGLWGVAASVYHPSGLSLISTGVESRGRGFAYHGMAGNVGIALGPLVTALLLLAFDWRLVTGLLVVPSLVAVAYALTTDFDETAAVSADGGDDGATDDRSPSLSTLVADSRSLFTLGFSLVLVVVMMNGLFYRGTLTFLPDVLSGFLPDVSLGLFEPGSRVAERFDLASYLYVGLLIVGISGQYVAGRLTDRIETTAGLAAVLASLCVVAAVFVPVAEAGVIPLVIVSALLGFLLFAIQPFYQAAIADYTPPTGRGLSYGFTYVASFGVGAAGAATAGLLLDHLTVHGTFLGLAVFPVVGAGISLVLYRSDIR